MTEVGFGSAVITPPMPVVLAGFGARKGPVDEVRHDLEAHAVVIRADGRTLCLLVLDLLMLGPDVAGPLRAAVGRELGIPASDVLPSCTHTHSGPAATRSTKRIGWPIPAGYVEVLTAGCVSAAAAALRAAVPATLGYARAGLPEGLSVNRRGLPYDPSYAVLDVRGLDGARIGSIGNVGIHPVALSPACRAVSGDWVTSYRTAVAAATGAPAVLLQGALGDVNPARDPHTDPDPGGNWEYAESLGQEVAASVVPLLDKAVAVPSGLTASRRVARVRTGLSIPTVLSALAFRRAEVELVEWALGDVRLVSLPGEAFHALGRAVEQARGDRALLAAIAPTWQGYLPSPYGKGYEESMSYGRGFVARVSELLLQVPR